MAAEVVEVLGADVAAHDHDAWELDRGTWSVRTQVFPQADMPAVQLSIHAGPPLR